MEGLMGEVEGLAQRAAGAGTGFRGTVYVGDWDSGPQTKLIEAGTGASGWVQGALGQWAGESGEDNGWTERVTGDGSR